MKLVRLKSDIDLNDVNLGSLKPMETFYFAHVNFQDAIKQDSIYMVIKLNPSKDEKISIINISDGQVIIRDASQRVIKFKSDIVYYE